MATIAHTSASSTTPVSVTKTTLGASVGSTDTFTYTSGIRQLMVIDNVTAGSITPNIDGDGAVSEYVPGLGVIDTSGGYTFAPIAAGATAVIDLDAIKAFLKGTITITGGDGAEVSILDIG